MPEDKGGKAGKMNVEKNYELVDQISLGKHKNEQDKWEAEHYNSTKFKFGAGDKFKGKKEKEVKNL
jgi:hypothetical protein